MFIALAAPLASAQPAVPVTLHVAETGPVVARATVPGTVTSPRAAGLSTEIAGLVEAVLVEEGDRVEVGDALLRLDRELASLALEGARASVERAERELADARRRHEEAQVLARDKSIAATTVRDLAAEVQIDGAALRQARADAAAQAARVERYELRAPFAGVISQKRVEAGEWVSPGDPVLELVGDTDLRVEARVPQEHFPGIDTETPVTLVFDALPGRRFSARVAAVVPVSDPTLRSFLLRVSAELERPVTVGMSARVMLEMDTGRRAVILPRDALLRHRDGRTTVWVTERDGGDLLARERPVEVGVIFGDRVEIRAGLEPGESVVLRGNEALQPGQRITIAADAEAN